MAISPRLRQIMFFTRLRAAGNFNPKCALEKGRCKGKYTKTSAQALSKTEFANTNKKSKNYAKMLSQAAKNKSKNFDRKAATEALSKATGKGNKISIQSSRNEKGELITKARARGEKDVRKVTKLSKSQQLTQQLRESKKAVNYKLKGKKERASRIAEMAKTNPSLRGEAAKAAKEAKPTAKQQRQFGAAKSRIAKQKKKEGRK